MTIEECIPNPHSLLICKKAVYSHQLPVSFKCFQHVLLRLVVGIGMVRFHRYLAFLTLKCSQRLTRPNINENLILAIYNLAETALKEDIPILHMAIHVLSCKFQSSYETVVIKTH